MKKINFGSKILSQHRANVKKIVSEDQNESIAIKTVARMNWKTNNPNPLNLAKDEIDSYKNIILNTICDGHCCKYKNK